MGANIIERNISHNFVKFRLYAKIYMFLAKYSLAYFVLRPNKLLQLR